MHRLERTIELAIGLQEAWNFFSDPRNLPEITPPDLQFCITGSVPEKMYAGMILTYTVRPFLKIPITWVTEITHVKEQQLFVDEQRYGPYRMWHHQHLFRATARGTAMVDLVDYILPAGPLGKVVHWFSVRQKLNDIFDYRERVLIDKFGVAESV